MQTHRQETGRETNMSDPRKRTILIVDDHALVRRGLRELLESEEDLAVCAECADAPAALGAMQEHKPDLMIVDVVLSEGSGLELVKQALSLRPEQRILVTSFQDERHFGERSLAAGALGYVSKQEPTERLLEAIRTAIAGRTYVSETLAEQALLSLSGGGEGGGSFVSALSDRELEVLTLIGNGLTTKEIAGRLNLSSKTIDSHREHIKAKLSIHNMNELIRVAAELVRDPGASAPASDGSPGGRTPDTPEDDPGA
jgi:DNA-binding NarL/FixJ family response regulator